MPKFDFSRHALPTPYERELLTILIEEAAEVQQRATKLLRFGAMETQPGQFNTNAWRLSQEIGDLVAVINLALRCGLVIENVVDAQVDRKISKLKDFMQHEPD
jgi:hypothetical protein